MEMKLFQTFRYCYVFFLISPYFGKNIKLPSLKCHMLQSQTITHSLFSEPVCTKCGGSGTKSGFKDMVWL